MEKTQQTYLNNYLIQINMYNPTKQDEKKGRDLFESLLKQVNIKDYEFTEDRYNRVDCYFTNNSGDKWAVEIKVRKKEWWSLFMEVGKFREIWQLIEDKKVAGGLYVNFIGNKCFIFNLADLTKKNGCYLSQINTFSSTDEWKGFAIKPMINIPLKNAQVYELNDNKEWKEVA